MFLSQYVKESPEGQYRAEIHESPEGYFIDYYGPTGVKMKTENFDGMPIRHVALMAENWINNIKVLNG
jgi:hypothetical protein